MTIDTQEKAVVELASGLFINLLNPKWDDINFYDIAHSLEVLPRFGGHGLNLPGTGPFGVPKSVTVAQHSIMVSMLMKQAGLPKTWQLAGLLHDASEAYLGDIKSPLKYSSAFDAYRVLEAKYEWIIYCKYVPELIGKYNYNLDTIKSVIKPFDTAALAHEAYVHMQSSGSGYEWDFLNFEPGDNEPIFLQHSFDSNVSQKNYFTTLFDKLTEGIQKDQADG